MFQRFQSPFGRHSTASEVIDGVDLSGERAIVTGAGSGIGIETARALASAGAEVALAVRRPQAAGQIASGITCSTGNTKVSVRALDLADQDSVRSFAAAWDQPVGLIGPDWIKSMQQEHPVGTVQDQYPSGTARFASWISHGCQDIGSGGR